MLDDDQEYALGVLEVPLCQILPCADLTLEQRFQLDHSGLDSLISMRLVLRVNCSPGPPGKAGAGALVWSKVGCPRTRYLVYVGKEPGDGCMFFVTFRILSAIISSNIAPPILLILLLCWTFSSSPPDLTSSSHCPSLYLSVLPSNVLSSVFQATNFFFGYP